MDPCSLASLTDEQLLLNVKALAARERESTVQLIASLAEVDARRLYLGEGFPSLFAYCTQVLHLSEHAAYGRIEAVRAVRRFPEVLEHLADGVVTLTTVCLLAPLLTSENHEALLAAARHKSRREVEQLVAMTRPKPDVPAVVRKLPSPLPPAATDALVLGDCASPPSPPSLQAERQQRQLVAEPLPVCPQPRAAVVMPLAPERFKIQFTASREVHDKLRRAQALLRHVIPNGDPAVVFERALDALLADLERKKLALTSRPHQARPTTPGSRHIPAAVRREVWRRDRARCAFVGTAGRCLPSFSERHDMVQLQETALGPSDRSCCASSRRNTTRFEPSRVLAQHRCHQSIEPHYL